MLCMWDMLRESKMNMDPRFHGGDPHLLRMAIISPIPERLIMFYKMNNHKQYSRCETMFRLLPLLFCLVLAACGAKTQSGASYPTRVPGKDEIVYSDQKEETVFGEDKSLGDKLFGGDDEETEKGAGIGVNSFLWRASLDTISFMPIASADPFGGVILTDWYENPDTPGERFKMSVYIMDKQLRADGVRVSVFKQAKTETEWRDARVPDDMAKNIEDTILTRARELRVVQAGKKS